MRNVLEVLREKEDAIERIRREVEALRSATPLLAGEMSSESAIFTSQASKPEGRTETVTRQADTFAAAVPLFDEGANDAFAKIRARLIEAGENNPQHLGVAEKISRHLRHFAAPLLSATLR